MFINFPWQTVSLLDFEAIFHDCPTMFDLFIKLYQQICWLESIPFTAGCRISRFSYVPSCWLYSHLQSIKYISYYMHKLIYIYMCVLQHIMTPLPKKGLLHTSVKITISGFHRSPTAPADDRPWWRWGVDHWCTPGTADGWSVIIGEDLVNLDA